MPGSPDPVLPERCKPEDVVPLERDGAVQQLDVEKVCRSTRVEDIDLSARGQQALQVDWLPFPCDELGTQVTGCLFEAANDLSHGRKTKNFSTCQPDVRSLAAAWGNTTALQLRCLMAGGPDGQSSVGRHEARPAAIDAVGTSWGRG